MNAAVSKTVVRVKPVPWVRIPPSPPLAVETWPRHSDREAGAAGVAGWAVARSSPARPRRGIDNPYKDADGLESSMTISDVRTRWSRALAAVLLALSLALSVTVVGCTSDEPEDEVEESTEDEAAEEIDEGDEVEDAVEEEAAEDAVEEEIKEEANE